MKILSRKIDNSPLIIFRIMFGFLLAIQCFKDIATGAVYRNFIQPKFTFSHIGMEWLQPLPGNGMYWYFSIMGIFALLVMIGYKYRWSLLGFTLLWAGVYYMQKTVYNNHYYLLLLVCLIMLFLPAHTYASLDSKSNPKIRQLSMPVWCSYALLLQIAIVYFYAAIAKLYPEWLDGTFTGNLLMKKGHSWGISLFQEKRFHLFIAYAGIAFDLFIVPLLLFKRTRLLALSAAVFFHLFNWTVLKIGIFPFFSLSLLVFFFPPERIRQLFFRKKPVYISEATSVLTPKDKRLLLWFFLPFFIIQILLPIRHHFIKGDVIWTEEGHRLSWRMMLRTRTGYAEFKIVDKKTSRASFYDLNKILTPKQRKHMQTRPDLLWQTAQYIKNQYAQNNQDVAIYITAKTSINKSPARLLIDPNTDMGHAKWNYFAHNEWIILYE